MSFPVVNVQPRPSASSQIISGLGPGLEKLLEIHRERKESDQIAKFYNLDEKETEKYKGLPKALKPKFLEYKQNTEQQKSKDLAGLTKYMEKELKNRGSTYLGTKDFEKIRKAAEDQIKKGIPLSEAFENAFTKARTPEKGEDPEKQEKAAGQTAREALFGPLLGKLTEPSGKTHPSGASTEFWNDKNYLKTLVEHPKEALADIPLQALGGVEQIIDLLSLGGYGRGAEKITGKDRGASPLSAYLSEKTGKQNLAPQEQENLDVGSFAASFLPWMKALGALKGAGGTGLAAQAAKTRPPVRPDLLEGVLPKSLTHQPSPAAPAPGSPSGIQAAKAAAKAVAKEPPPIKATEAPKTATEMRVARTEPEARIYPRLQNIELRETQLKNHPKYVEEIQTDAAERAERADKRVPKTAAGQLSMMGRKQVAQSALPKIEESYTRSIARVRALEDEVVKLSGPARENAETLLELAQQDLDNALFHLKQGVNNAKTGEKRVGIPDMQDAARRKMISMADDISDGKEVKLAKMDYSPDLIKEAKAIKSRKKQLPSSKPDDFYNTVHDVYADEYKHRIATIDKEIASSPKSLQGAENIRNLQKEKGFLQQMVESADAEKVIHRHKLGLREMAERQKAKERFSKLKPVEGKPEVAKAAQEKMWRGRIQELVADPEKIPEIAAEAIEEAAAANPKVAEQIRKEEPQLKEALEDVYEFWKTRTAKTPPNAGKSAGGGKKPPPPKPGTPPPAPGEYVKKANTRLKQLQNLMDGLLSKIPYFGKTDEGKDFVVGVLTGIWDETRHEFGLNVTSGQAVAVFYKARGRGTRYAANQATRWLIHKGKLEVAKHAQKTHNEELFNKFSNKIQKEARESV